MSTRGAIARLSSVVPVVFAGVYHHWDSYPRGLGKTLWDLYHGYFHQDLEQMLSVLIDQHPAGWSTINGADFNQVPGFCEIGDIEGDAAKNGQLSRPQCYCHGDRAEEPWTVTQQNASGSGCEYVYAFTAYAPAPDIPTVHIPTVDIPTVHVPTVATTPDVGYGQFGYPASSGQSQKQQQPDTAEPNTTQQGKTQHATMYQTQRPHSPHMLVLSSYTVDGQKMIGMFGVGDPKAVWRVIAVLALNGPEPDWQRMDH